MKKPRIARAPWFAVLLAVLFMLGVCAGLAEDASGQTAAVPSLTDADATVEANASAANEAAADETGTDEAALAAALAAQIYEEAAQEEISVTPLLQSLETDAIHLIGLEHRPKAAAQRA